MKGGDEISSQLPGHIDYSVPDAMMDFAKQHNIAVNVIWDNPRYQPGWINSLSPNDLRKAVEERVGSIVTRYKGRLIAWDVLGQNASAVIYNLAGKADGTTTLFLNEFYAIEKSEDVPASPAKYLQKLKEIQSFPGNGNLRMGIGLESHFTVPNLPYMRASLDTLASANMPIWLTEVDVKGSPTIQAQYLQQILREAHSYPKITGMVMRAAWRPQGCYRMCLTDNNLKNLATGDVVDKLLHEWGGSVVGMTDAYGFFEASLAHGDYNVKITRHGVTNISSSTSNLKVAPTDARRTTLLHQVAA
ncbi:unnamed protein product [Dovyalis caffra]|uniref:GH10 domain-containing protein n=1 Tax=Dovyalis caffra TaxID=77055 RepID=A0AAV1R9C3_9ROSI|nr:unnamed protein product [Dovyalis caffra]